MTKMPIKTSNYNRGLWAEYYAAFILALKGYKILKLRAKTKLGEIDILVAKGSTLIAVEVKASHSYDHASHKIDARKKARVHGALTYLSTQKPYTHYQSYRFDAFVITGVKFYHIMDAW